MRRGFRGTIGATLEELGHASSLEVEIEYAYTPGEPMVRYYPDGSGYPGSPPEAELLSVYVERWDVGDERRRRNDHWLWTLLDEMARDRIERDCDTYYYDRCVEDAAERSYDDDREDY
jgi:hypothetical protein